MGEPPSEAGVDQDFRRDARREAERVRVLLELHARGHQLSDRELYDYALEQAVRLTDSTIGFFHQIAADQRTIVLTAWNRAALAGCTATYETHYPLEQAGNWVECVRRKAPVIYNDYPNSPGRRGLPLGHFPVTRFMSIPVLDGECVRLIFGVGNKTEPYDAQDCAQLQLVANELHRILLRRRAEAAIRESEERYRLLFESSNDGIFLCRVADDGQMGKFVEVNDVVCERLGYRRPELLDLTPGNIDVGDSTEPQSGLAERLLRDQHALYETEYLTRHGVRVPVEINARVVELGSERLVLGIMRDITERKRTEEELKRLNLELEQRVAARTAELVHATRVKSEFVANMSHEIRTPLNAVIGFSELLASEVTDAKHRAHIQAIHTAGRSLLTLINDILDLSKIEAGSMRIQAVPVDPRVVLREIESVFAQRVDGKELELTVEIDPSLPPALVVDETRLRQVLFNLVGNAVKFTDRGHVRLVARAERHDSASVDLVMAVEDTGIGIPRMEQASIFEAFRQQAGQSALRYGGTGLGLAISKRLVELMGGSISVESVVGRGSTFTLSFRGVAIAEHKSVPNRAPGIDLRGVRFRRALLLVVDDEESNRSLMQELLEDTNLEVCTAPNGLEAVRMARDLRPDAILMDLRMPVMDGRAAAEELKRDPSTARIPVVGLTAGAVPEAGAAEDCFAYLLPKPVSAEKLLELLGILVGFDAPSVRSPPPSDAGALDEAVRILTGQSAVLESIRRQLGPALVALRGAVPVARAAGLAETLASLGQQARCELLAGTGERLRAAAAACDIGRIKAELGRLNLLVERLPVEETQRDGG